MLSKEAFIHFMLHGSLPAQASTPAPAPAAKAASGKKAAQQALPQAPQPPAAPTDDALGGFGFGDASFADAGAADDPFGDFGFDASPVPSPAQKDTFTLFARNLLEAAGFGEPELESIQIVKGTDDTVRKHLPPSLWYWEQNSLHPHQTLQVDLTSSGRELLDSYPDLKKLDLLEDALARVAQAVLRGFQYGLHNRSAAERRGRQGETLVVISVLDDRADGTPPVPLLAFATKAQDIESDTGTEEGLELFRISAESRHWTTTPALIHSHLGAVYDRHFSRLEGEKWKNAFITGEERKRARDLCKLCTPGDADDAKPDVKKILDGAHKLLDEISRSFGFEQRASLGNRRLLSRDLPENHDIGMDAERLELGELKNPFIGMTVRDLDEQLLGYLVYGTDSAGEAKNLRDYLKEHNRFHNVLVIYPENGQAVVELWHEKKCLQGRLRKSGERFAGTARVVDMLSRFFVVSRSRIRNPKELAEDLAHRARYLRRLARLNLAQEAGQGPLSELYASFQASLIHDMKPDEFSDAFTQTITYGLLTARWAGKDELKRNRKLRFTRSTALKLLPSSSPFLNGLFDKVLNLPTQDNKQHFLWLVDDLADLLNRIDVEYVFGEGDKDSDVTTDPVIHFYEPFLAAYDKVSRKGRGVYYTPQPVVSYIVRSVHALLQTEFGLEDGLADTATWGDMLKKHPGLKLPPLTDEPGEARTLSPDEPFVQILDPATGTGTFLVEVIEVIHHTLMAKWQPLSADARQARWNAYVPEHLLPRLHAFELMMASYAIAHLKISLKLAETGYHFAPHERARIYLTNALEPKVKQLPSIHFEAMADEAKAVNEVKWYKRFTVVIGNPPYAGNSANRGEWIESLIDQYRKVDGQPLGEMKVWLKDDYVKFIRMAEYSLSVAGVGILSLITNNSFFDGLTFRGMRHHLFSNCDFAFFLNLHGNKNLKERAADGAEDDNVFDILQGVGISIVVRLGNKSSTHAAFSADLLGSREFKYSHLKLNHAVSNSFVAVKPSSPNYFITQQDAHGLAEYERLARIPDLFDIGGLGFQSHRDNFAVAFTAEELTERIKKFFDLSLTDVQVKEMFEIGDYERFIVGKYRREHSFNPEHIKRIQYRVFDFRYVYFADLVIQRRLIRVHGHLLSSNLGMNVVRQTKAPFWRHAMVSQSPTPAVFLEIKDGSSQYPLYRYNELEPSLFASRDGRVPNFRDRIIADWLLQMGLRAAWIPKTTASDKLATPEDIFHYIYAVFHSPGYRSRYAEFLKIDFPRVPLTSSLELFRTLSALGEQLVGLHLLESSTLEQSLTTFVAGRSLEVEKITWAADTVWIDKKQTTGFVGVPEEVWNFHVGGYQVCEKWLKDRKGRMLSPEDIAHYHKIVVALSETIRLMQAIDDVIDAHGGWPGAFTASTEGQTG